MFRCICKGFVVAASVRLWLRGRVWLRITARVCAKGSAIKKVGKKIVVSPTSLDPNRSDTSVRRRSKPANVIRHRWVKKIKSKVKRKGGFILSGLSKRLTFLLILFFLLFAIVACNRGGSQTVSAKDDGVIQSYLDQKVLSPLFGGKVFSAHKVLGTAEGKVYVWALLQEYYKKDNKLEMGTGWSVPLVLTVQNGTNGMVVSEHKYPGDGSLFTTDVKSLFPKGLQQEIFDFPSTQNSRDLENQAKIRAEQWAKQ